MWNKKVWGSLAVISSVLTTGFVTVSSFVDLRTVAPSPTGRLLVSLFWVLFGGAATALFVCIVNYFQLAHLEQTEAEQPTAQFMLEASIVKALHDRSLGDQVKIAVIEQWPGGKVSLVIREELDPDDAVWFDVYIKGLRKQGHNIFVS